MKKLSLLLLGLFFSLPVFADINPAPLMNKVTLQLQAEQWVTTKTAQVFVAINAAVTSQGIEKIQTDIVQKLNQLSDKGEWHVVSFQRQLDKTGLESVQISAEARLPQTELAGLRDKAKSLSKPGETFTIDNVQFVPSEDEIRQANSALRNALYLQAKTEMDNLNKVYPEQKYYLHQIDFMFPPMALPANTMMINKAASMAAAPERTPVSVGNKVELQAVVVFASLPDALTQRITNKI